MTEVITSAVNRRTLLGSLGLGSAGLMLGGCDAVPSGLNFGESLHYQAQRGLLGQGLAREYRLDQRSPVFRMNGNRMPRSEAYARHLANDFADWRLIVDGLVQRPLALSMADLMRMPSRSQVTRHDCVEGWSAIGQWTGTPLAAILRQAGLRRSARFIAFHCADDFSGRPYYESIDLTDAFHPQTILAWGMNGGRLPVGHGAPLRLRVERQLGYKQAKFVMRVEARDSLAGLHGGRGGLWEDRVGYEWYAGI
jgi:DMSO/TMAO reductase YedYZ molybdopterin-dependent catalytic subunit